MGAYPGHYDTNSLIVVLKIAISTISSCKVCTNDIRLYGLVIAVTLVLVANININQR